ncbi:adenylate kinase 1, putative, partial [Perkinsus marinus ATCC 50983]
VMSVRNAARVDGYILDGFPRVLEQAQMWSDLTLGDGNPELVINISLARSVLIHKLASRRICGSCGDNYNLADIRYGHYDMPPMLPKAEGICDSCGSGLIRRDDDTDEIIQHRLDLHFDKEEPLLDFYR